MGDKKTPPLRRSTTASEPTTPRSTQLRIKTPSKFRTSSLLELTRVLGRSGGKEKAKESLQAQRKRTISGPIRISGSPMLFEAALNEDAKSNTSPFTEPRAHYQLPKPNMEPTRLQPSTAATMATKSRQIEQAKEMELLVAERAKRSGDEAPPYDFLELIGKGAYGRVFKAKNRAAGSLVAVKIIDIDKFDYEAIGSNNLSETLKEISILKQLRDSKARPYVNLIEEARTVHNELWIVSEYASGGSVHTLMKPVMTMQRPGLEEKYIIPIARELAMGLRFIHEAGVLHRDLKCKNVLIDETGRVQLCDFGVSGVLEPAVSKRSTIVGTPHYMAPELQKEWVKDADPSSRAQPEEILYGSEVDIWAYGCTIFEMATGNPPFHRTQMFEIPNQGVPRLDDERFSENLRGLVNFILQGRPRDRPTPEQILDHPYLQNTSKSHTTGSLVALLDRYYEWERSGGARASLFMPYGAQAPDPLAPELEDEDDEWTFSISDEFENKHMSMIGGQNLDITNAPPEDDSRFAKLQQAFKEEQIQRAGKRLHRLFDPNAAPYRFSGSAGDRPPSDLMLRDFNPDAPIRESVIDLDFAAPTSIDAPSIDLGEVPTLRANRMNRGLRELEEEDENDSFEQDQQTRRATRDWKFPSTSNENRNTREWTFPSMQNENRNTRDWRFPAAMQTERPNRRTVEWTFQTAMAEADYEPEPPLPTNDLQGVRRRLTNNLDAPILTAPLDDNRRTRDFVFPPRDNVGEGQGSSLSDQGPGHSFQTATAHSPSLGPGFRPPLRHNTTEPLGTFGDFYPTNSAPVSPLRTSMIDLDMANVDDFNLRPSTADSGNAGSAYTAGTTEFSLTGNPFDLEDQVQLSQRNSTTNRQSFHMKSQSEPNHHVPGLFTPNDSDAEHGYESERSERERNSGHGYSVSSVSQIKPPPSNRLPGYPIYHPSRSTLTRPHQQTSLPVGGVPSDYYDSSSSPPVSADEISAEEELEDLFDSLGFEATAFNENGRLVLDFQMPRATDQEALMADADVDTLAEALRASSAAMLGGLRGMKDVLRGARGGDV